MGYIYILMISMGVSFVLAQAALLFTNKRKLKKAETLYRFCNRRRSIMKLAREGALDVNSLTFKFAYEITSTIIHYSEQYRFSSKEFLSMFGKEVENKLEDTPRAVLIREDIMKQSPEVRKVVHGLFADLIISFYENSYFTKLVTTFAVIAKAVDHLNNNVKEHLTVGQSVQFTKTAKEWEGYIPV